MRFHSASERQVGLYNLKSGRTVEIAPIKSQCARDYFYTKDPKFENAFAGLEGVQKKLIAKIIDESYVPPVDSLEHHELISLIMFQTGRTVSTAARQDHLYNEFGKAILQKQFERDKRDDLLAFLPEVELSLTHGVLESIGQHLAMYPLIGDLEITLFVNNSKEDFLTSDHPVALCNNLPPSSPQGANLGFASRGLIVLLPLSPRSLLFLSDPEVYKTARDEHGVVLVTKVRDTVELNLTQCFNAHDNLYFAQAQKVQETIAAFQRRKEYLRPPLPSVVETAAKTSSGRMGVLLSMPVANRRMALPGAVELRRAAKTGKYKKGDTFVRDPLRATAVQHELDRLESLRKNATEQAEQENES